MQKDNRPDKPSGSKKQEFLATLLQGLIRDTVGLWITFLIGTGAAAIMCLYFGAPLIFSLLGGILVLAVVPGHGYETALCAGYAAILTPVAAPVSRAFCSALI